MTRQEADCIVAVVKGVRKQTGNQLEPSYVIDEKGIETIINMVEALGNVNATASTTYNYKLDHPYEIMTC